MGDAPQLQSATPRVLVVASDRRFRAVAATLLSQRGYTVSVAGHGEDVIELAIRERADVVVLDASASLTAAARQAARLESLRPRVAVVAVAADPGDGLAALPIYAKWGTIDELLMAIRQARSSASSAGLAHA
jgi:CheY-like chemotaxis protein